MFTAVLDWILRYFPAGDSFGEARRWTGVEVHMGEGEPKTFANAGPGHHLSATTAQVDKLQKLPFAISLQSKSALIRTTKIPRLQQGQIAAVADSRTNEFLPVPSNSVFAGWCTEANENPHYSELIQCYIKKSAVEASIAKAGLSLLQCKMLFLRDADLKAMPMAWTPEGNAFGETQLQFWRRATVALWLVALLLTSLIFMIRTFDLRRHEQELEAQIDALTTPVAEVQATLKQIHSVEETLKNLLRLERHSNEVLIVLESVAANLDDSVALGQFRMDATSLYLEGLARRPEDVIAATNQVAGLQGAAFASPIVNQGEWSAFSLRAERSGAAE